MNWVLTTLSYPLLAILVILAVKDEEKVGTKKGDVDDFASAKPLTEEGTSVRELSQPD